MATLSHYEQASDTGKRIMEAFGEAGGSPHMSATRKVCGHFMTLFAPWHPMVEKRFKGRSGSHVLLMLRNKHGACSRNAIDEVRAKAFAGEHQPQKYQDWFNWYLIAEWDDENQWHWFAARG